MDRRPPSFGLSLVLHIAALALITATAPPEYWRLSARGSGSGVTKVSNERLRPFPGVPGEPTIPPADETKDLEPIVDPKAPTTLIIQGFTFDFSKVSDRATELFPFLTLQLPLDSPAVEHDPASRARLLNPFAKTAASDPNPPLVLSDNAVQNVVDSAWSRRYRWRVFRPVRELTMKYNADAGRLPLVLRRYADETMLQPYLDTEIADMRLWTELGGASRVVFVNVHVDRPWQDPNNAVLAQGAARYPNVAVADWATLASQNPQWFGADGTHLAIDGPGAHALATLINMSPSRMDWTRSTNPKAFELFTLMRRYYRTELERKNLGDYVALRLFFDRIRVAILTGIVKATPNGYRASDARFLIGSIYWRQLREADAVLSWREMRIDAEDSYASAASRILEVIRRAGPDLQRIDRGAINDVIDEERRKWVRFWESRLERFGYAFDVY